MNVRRPSFLIGLAVVLAAPAVATAAQAARKDSKGRQLTRNVTFDYIKFDIEGAEIQALEGCKNIVRQHRPAMAVAVYHRPADLWQIPRIVDALLPQSRFFLRSHGHHGFELVLYVTP